LRSEVEKLFFRRLSVKFVPKTTKPQDKPNVKKEKMEQNVEGEVKLSFEARLLATIMPILKKL
jgi:hypothetical protein